MISPQYVDGLETRIAELEEQNKRLLSTVEELMWDGALNAAEARINELAQELAKAKEENEYDPRN